MLHLLRSYLNLFSFTDKVAGADKPVAMGASQDFFTQSKKPGISTQKFYKQKTLDFGMVVSMETTQGTWSEDVLASGSTTIFGYAVIQFAVVKNQSNYSMRGSSCMLDQVYDLPFKGSSSKPRCPIISLNKKMSLPPPPGRFLLSRDLMKLKSPSRSQF